MKFFIIAITVFLCMFNHEKTVQALECELAYPIDIGTNDPRVTFREYAKGEAYVELYDVAFDKTPELDDIKDVSNGRYSLFMFEILGSRPTEALGLRVYDPSWGPRGPGPSVGCEGTDQKVESHYSREGEVFTYSTSVETGFHGEKSSLTAVISNHKLLALKMTLDNFSPEQYDTVCLESAKARKIYFADEPD